MEGIWILALVAWVVSALFRQAKQREEAGSRPLPRPRRVGRAARPRPLPAESPSEGAVAEDWRREIEQLLGVRTGPERGPLGRPSSVPLPEAEEVEERETLEVQERAPREEPTGDRAPPEVRDQDEEAEGIIQGRLAVAEARLHGRTRADHERLDQMLRAPPEPQALVKRLGRPRLRQAIVWREILGPPVSLRDWGQDRL